jgi:hypothetical protein
MIFNHREHKELKNGSLPPAQFPQAAGVEQK